MARISLVGKARYLRKAETNAEKILWDKLRGSKLGIKFRRQHPVDKYVLDFYAPEVKLAIELDGSIHGLKENKEYDMERTSYLYDKYIEVLRFYNSEVESNVDKVLQEIISTIHKLGNTPLQYSGEGPG